ncbi:broad-complex core protein [Anopheles cruzii]|uniref:broad-complex core protein n=1 Tax=Anopheles cruzii TaxID=68878 RepID=UPI0022EC6508|nr:broad-complex core protein [Anopheles cruzii]
MVDTQHFCLRWNNYQSSITSAFENLRDDEDFVDVTLACDGRSLKAHRVVLSACSTYFRELLKSTPCKHPVIVLQDVAFTDLHALVEFIYHGEVNVHQRSLSSFLKTAEILRVSGLTQQQAEETHGIHTSLGANLPSGVVHHPIYPEKMLDDSLYVSHGVSPPPHLAGGLPNSGSPHHSTGGGGPGGANGSGGGAGGPMVNQLLKRAAAAAALRRERNNSSHSDEMALKRHRMSVESNGPTGQRGDPDVICNTPQTTATDFSSSATKQHHNLPSPQGKDLLLRQDTLSGHPNSGSNSFSLNSSSNLIKSSINNNNINNNNNNSNHNLNNNMLLHSKENSGSGGVGSGVGGGVCGVGLGVGVGGSMPASLGTSNGSNAGSLCSAEKESLASSPSERSAEDVKSEPLELLCGAGGDHENSSDSVPDDHVDLVKGGLDVKGSLRSPHEHDLDSSMHHHSGAQFLMSAGDNKMFPSPASFNFSMAALADPAALAGFNTQALQAVELAGSPQGMSMASMAAQRPSSPLEGSVHGAGGVGGGHGHGGVNRLALPLPLAACHRCDVCGKLLSTKLTLKRHKEQQHLQPLNNAVCNLCHKVFRTLNSLNNHKSIYHRRQKILHHHHAHHLHGQHPFAAVAAAVGGGGGGGSVSPLHHGAGGPGGGPGGAGSGPGHHELLNNNASASDCDIKHSVAAKLEYM